MFVLQRSLVSTLLLLSWLGAAYAQGLTTMTVLDSTGATKTYRMVQDASSRLSQTHSICDPTVGANATTNCATVTNGALTVGGTDLDTIVTNTTGVTQASSISGLTAALIAGQTLGGLAQVPFIDPCQANVPTILPFTIPTNTTTNILAGTASKKTYVCYLYMQTGLANNVAVIEGTTGATCGTSTAALVGGVTAATGLLNAANSGQAFGNGGFSVLQTQTNQNDICIITSASGPLSGVLKYVKQ